MTKLMLTSKCRLTNKNFLDIIMANSWSFLSDEIMSTNEIYEDSLSGITSATKEDWNDFWRGDGINLTDNPYYRTDTITINDDQTINLDMTNKNPTRFKYSEERILKELTDYISATYNQHYSAGDDKVQTLDLIEACGDGESFCRSNILKYASRYDKKGTARRDIMKILHYAVLLMHFNDKNAQRETYPQ